MFILSLSTPTARRWGQGEGFDPYHNYSSRHVSKFICPIHSGSPLCVNYCQRICVVVETNWSALLIGLVSQSVCLSVCLPVCLSWSTRQLKVVAGNWDRIRCKIASELNWPHLLYMTSSYWILTERQPCLPVSFFTLTIHCALQLHTPIISSLPSSSCEHFYLNYLLPTRTGT